MKAAADHTQLADAEPPAPNEPPTADEPAPADDIVYECGLGSFPASDPPSWWADAGLS